MQCAAITVKFECSSRHGAKVLLLLHDKYITEMKLSLCIYKTDIAFLFTGPCPLLTNTLELPSRTSST